MSRILRKIILVILSALLTFLFGGLAQASQHPVARKQKQSSAPQPVVPQGPLPQPTLDQMPAIPPQVTYQAGQLTIQAQNSTLGDILRAVRAKTGASVDIPSNADERVVGRLGPGPAREVLASLLNGSHFNYVMVGSATDPGAVQQVILTSKSGGTTTAAARAGAPQVIVPHVYDQHYFAERIDQLGVGVAHAPATPTVDSLVAALNRALQPEVAVRAKSLGNAVRTDGATIAAEHVTSSG